MATLQSKLQERTSIMRDLEAILNIAEKEKRDVSDSESRVFDELEAQLDKLDNEIREMRGKEDNQSMTIRTRTNNKEFRNLGEYLYTMAFNDDDQRFAELRAQQIGQGALGGYMVPEQFSDELFSVNSDEAVVRPRATIIPPGDMPDAPIKIPALAQGAASNRWGNFQIYHKGELKTLTEANINLRQVTLTPHKMTGYMTTSNELLRNWKASGGILMAMMRKAMMAAEDTDFLNGNGVDKALGVQSSPAAIIISRQTANQISYTDVVNMVSRLKLGGRPVWVASQTTFPQLANIRDAGNNNLWMEGVKNGIPTTLMGYPVMFSERSAPLGSRADLMLCDFSYYLIKNGSGPLVSVSEHVGFQEDSMAFRIIWYVDGASWLDEPIPLEGATSNTVSPFVVLE